jgi:DnaJ-class molecular chaperone
MVKVDKKKYEVWINYVFFSIGEIIAQKDKCNLCQGDKIIEEKKTLDVVILPGYSHGKKIKFRGENNQLVRIIKKELN